MKKPNILLTLFAGTYLLSSTFLSPAHALEGSATGAEKSPDMYDVLMNKANKRLDALQAMLAEETNSRKAEDAFMHADLDTLRALAKDLQSRLDILETTTLPALQKRVDDFPPQIAAEVNALRTRLASVKAELNGDITLLTQRVNNANNRLTKAETDIATLYNNINGINNGLNDLDNQLRNTNNRLANLEALTNYIQIELAKLAACVANGTCTGAATSPHIEIRDFDLDGGWDIGLATRYRYTGLNTAEWQFCAVSGATNQSNRDFNVYREAGQWVMSTENDNAWFGDERGNLYVRCMKITFH